MKAATLNEQMVREAEMYNTIADNSTEIALMFMTLEYVGRLYTTAFPGANLSDVKKIDALESLEERFYTVYLDLEEKDKEKLSPYLRIFTMGKYLQKNRLN
ncbi:hypothetical protein [Pseudemcibacter aquimaris]|uniref:hypothetical protein n=1 Tax=Pseudemcibacter aquimaris TaxID=2857064 RepID=UPI0020137A67|nr:hypothetical protein [Pseudemcibacter aquimaris]MCC3860958.1 hypothetical protein [Pseudemcibacter aquimaris]WDU59776.1 hypothetical protein KW060_05845 [Pseudemcibacter aquimaris]